MAADFSLNFGPELNRSLAVAAAHNGMSRAAFVRDACTKALASLAQTNPALAVHLDAVSRQIIEAAK